MKIQNLKVEILRFFNEKRAADHNYPNPKIVIKPKLLGNNCLIRVHTQKKSNGRSNIIKNTKCTEKYESNRINFLNGRG